VDPEKLLQGLLEDLATMSEKDSRRETVGLLEELQAALTEHRKLIDRQYVLIQQISADLKDVRDEPRSP